MKCPYCGSYVSDRAVERNDGLCPECDAFIDHEDLTEDDVADVRDDEEDDDDDLSDFGLPEASYSMQRDEFDDFLEEEEEYERRQAMAVEQAKKEMQEKERRKYGSKKQK